MKNQQNYTLFFTLSPHILNYSMVQILLVFPSGQGFPNVPNDSIYLFPKTLSSLDPDSVNLGWCPRNSYFLKYLPGHLILREDEATLSLDSGPFLPLGLCICSSLCLSYNSPCSSQVQLLLIPQATVFMFSSQKDLP